MAATSWRPFPALSIVSGGRSIGGPESFTLLEDVAARLGGIVGDVLKVLPLLSDLLEKEGILAH